MASASIDRTLKIWNAKTGALLITLRGHGGIVNDCAFSFDGSRIVSASADTVLKLWNASTGDELATLAGHDNSVKACAFSPDGAYIISASFDATLKVWNAALGVEVKTLNGHTAEVSACFLVADGTRMLSGSSDGTLRLWSLTHGSVLATLNVEGWGDEEDRRELVEYVAVAPDGKHFVSASQIGVMNLIDLESGSRITARPRFAKSAKACTLSPDGTRVVLAADVLRQWDVQTGAELTPLGDFYASACAFSPGGTRLALTSDYTTLKLLDVPTGRVLCEFPGSGEVTELTWSPSGERLVVGFKSGEIQVLRLENLDIEPVVTTLRFLYRVDRRSFDHEPTADCPWCGRGFVPSSSVRDAVEGAMKNADSTREDSTSDGHAREAGDQEPLHGDCPNCHQPLKFNPYIIDNRGDAGF